MNRRNFLKVSGGALVTAWAAPNLLLADPADDEFPNLLRNEGFENWSVGWDPAAMPARYLVRYKVRGKNHVSGPYGRDGVLLHRDDIAGYEGITDVEVVQEFDNGPRQSMHQGWHAVDIPYLEGRQASVISLFAQEQGAIAKAPEFSVLRLHVPVKPFRPSGMWHNGTGVETEKWFMRWLRDLARDGKVGEAVRRAQQTLDGSALIARHTSGG